VTPVTATTRHNPLRRPSNEGLARRKSQSLMRIELPPPLVPTVFNARVGTFFLWSPNGLPIQGSMGLRT
jgi:hypothetical protein